MRAVAALTLFIVLTGAAGAQSSKKITYLYNSGWLIETGGATILVDYVPAEGSPQDSILFSKLKQASENKQGTYILISHEHYDHFHKPLLKWHEKIKGLTTILGWDFETTDPAIMTISGRNSLSAGPLTIVSHPSTDAGSGFLVTINSLEFYHSGDHAAWADDVTDEFLDEIRFIASRSSKIDIAFVPIVRGKGGACKSMESITNGAIEALRILKPAVAFPMHIQCDDLTPYKEFAALVKKQIPSIAVKAPSSNNAEFDF